MQDCCVSLPADEDEEVWCNEEDKHMVGSYDSCVVTCRICILHVKGSCCPLHAPTQADMIRVGRIARCLRVHANSVVWFPVAGNVQTLEDSDHG